MSENFNTLFYITILYRAIMHFTAYRNCTFISVDPENFALTEQALYKTAEPRILL